MKRARLLVLRLLIAFALLVLAFLIFIGWWGSGHMVSPQRRALQDYHLEILGTPAKFGLKIDPFTAGDGTPCLMVTASPHPGAAKKSRIARAELERRQAVVPSWGSQLGTIVLLYGHNGRKEDHLPICERFCAAGFRCLLMDLPGQGDHPAGTGSFGLHEAAQVEAVFDETAKRFQFAPAPACLFGVSQGGAIALQTAARSPGKWQAVASVSTFSSLDRPLLRSAEEIFPEDFHFCCSLAAFCVSCGTNLRAGFWPGDVRPVEAATQLRMPVFIAHGDKDPYIGIDQGRAIFDAVPAKRKQFRVVEGADHNRVLSMGSHQLYADLCEFFLTALNEPAVEFDRSE
ncbi:alpha/beta hydrolase family protein [Luteolibacter marinus]|uniref:alpha/beta hydrolase family protein n=1 Tax=Luteolibacter marinus TaxID=2776705 RepID=UPI001868A9C5|nr:alpha/beta fold hydrolase [Luteolibacter marinus]